MNANTQRRNSLKKSKDVPLNNSAQASGRKENIMNIAYSISVVVAFIVTIVSDSYEDIALSILGSIWLGVRLIVEQTK